MEFDQVSAAMTAALEDLQREYPGKDVEAFTRGYERGRDTINDSAMKRGNSFDWCWESKRLSRSTNLQLPSALVRKRFKSFMVSPVVAMGSPPISSGRHLMW